MGWFDKLVVACAWAAVSTAAVAQFNNPFGEEPKVSYSGVREMVTSEGTITMKEYNAPQMQRMEMDSPSGPVVMINRRDKGVAWMLMPSMNMFMEIPAAQYEEQAGGKVKVVEHEKVGTETIDGMKVDKYKSIFEDDQGNRGGGYYWITDDGIPIQMDLVIKEGEQKHRIKMKLKELKIGDQPPSLFEIPKGYTGMPTMGGMTAPTSMGGTGQQPPQEPAQEPEQKKKFGLKSLMDMY